MDENLLSAEQVLLLENLTYLIDDEPLKTLLTIKNENGEKKVLTVDYIVNEAFSDDKLENLDDDHDCDSYLTGADWKKTIQAIRNDETLCGMQLLEVYGDESEDSRNGALSALFVNEATGEAVVAFRGTAGYEWKDNFLGGAATLAEDGVSTEYQIKALEWYKSLDLSKYPFITVTGHSKGGNKAKYITIMDPSVTRCISFDGQGFSDEFYKFYEKEIARRQYAITNHNVNYDFVNLLLNDVGDKIYYQGFDYGAGRLLEAHCPNTYLIYDEQGNARMVQVDGQAAEMIALNSFLNNYLRSLTGEQKIEALEMAGDIADVIFNNKDKDEGADSPTFISKILGTISENDRWPAVANLAAYAGKYALLHPDFTDAIKSLIDRFYLSDAVKFIIKIRSLIRPLSGMTNLSYEALRYVAVFLNTIFGEDNSEDLQTASTYSPLGKNRVYDINRLKELGSRGKSLMQTGSAACRTWDAAVKSLKGLVESLPAEAQSAALLSSLNGLSLPFYKEDYDTMGTCIYNTMIKISEDMPKTDSEAAEMINEITENLSANIAVIKSLEEGICTNPTPTQGMGVLLLPK